MNTAESDLMAFLHMLESVFDQYCDELANQQGASLMALCHPASLSLPCLEEWE